MAATKKTRTRIAPAQEPTSQALAGLAKDLAANANKKASQPQNTEEAASEDDPVVMTTVINAYNLTLADGSIKHYEIGANRMPKSHAEHWYSKAHGVKIVD